MLPTLSNRGWINRPIDPFSPDLSRYLQSLDTEDQNLTASYPVDVREDDDNLYVEAELPGFTADQVDVTLDKGILRIAAERKSEDTQGKHHLKERRFTSVSRAFTLPTRVDPSNVKAHLEDGVLKLTLPKSQEAKPARIQIDK